MVPNKRIKLDTRDRQRNAIILSEIDIELGLRKRLAQTLESRIAWASLLLQSLTNETECTSEVSFKDVALNTLSILESSSDILFARDTIEVPSQNAATKSRPPPKEKPITRSQKSKFLYLRSQDSRRVILLRCAICHQSTFNTLQGLFNHGRILHSTDWGTHEECVKACAVLHEEPETQVDLEGGVDVGRGMLPGVKSLFQMAVEGTRDGETNGAYSELGSEEVAHRSIHLTKTLGLHSDSPALAQFLGKEAKRKIIKVWDDGGQIDITSFIDDDPQTLKKPRWKKTYTHRNCPEIKEEITFNNRNSRPTTAGSSSQVPNSAITVSSRFHVSCRVTLTDSSLFIPEGRLSSLSLSSVLHRSSFIDQRIEEKKDHTHQWMICAESASYSLDLTTALTSMTVTPISPSELEYSVSFHPLVATEPPFLVVGTTSEPFQARVELMFNPSTSGPGQNGQKVVLEHWVGLDMIGTNKLPTKGDEQVVDIELDKDTVLKPAKTGYVSLKAKSHWENVLNVKLGTESKPAVADVAPPEPTIPGSYTELLQSLVASFPMTLKDIPQNNPKLAPNIPYRLPADYNQFKTLIIGRQKAIEWARAKALQHAYTNHIQTLRKRDPCSHLVPLTTGDVYAWMEDNGHFIREEPKTKHVNVLDSKQDDVLTIRDYSEGRWCRVCGLGLWAHGTRGSDYIQTEAELAAATKESEENQLRLPKIRLRLLNGEVVGGGGPNASPSPPKPQPFQCQIVVKMLQLLKMPIVDVYRIFRLHTEKETEQISPTASVLNPRQLPPWSSRTYRLVRDHSTVVSAVDPRMILGIRSVVHALHLPSFQQLSSSPMTFPLDRLGQTATEVEANLSPYALLALAARQFIRVLIKEAAEIEKRDKELGVGLLFESHHRDVSVLASGPSGKKYKTALGTNAGKKGREKDKIKLQSIKVLTPMHIITGVVSNYVRATALASMPSEGRSSIGYEGGVGMAMFGCLSRIGVSVQEEREL
ncbi:hypothetical protein DFH05DRAFT_1527749 [Lentinula detonsa]|uniref:YEATS domain-containing protein n=1 Tax=Lentinula detonsa TaxID=2804962 RepID=A0A9W8NWF4_9AGAR|nr:hypothetical protein DFH05DRAFT_1527749 [Lentinula detonsa]